MRAALVLASLVTVLAPGFALGAELDLTVSGVERGPPVIVALCQGGFDPSQCRVVWRDASPDRAVEHARLTVPDGRYAVTAFQDANRNGRLDTVLGLPVERYGLSNEVGRFAPPFFARAEIAIVGRTAATIRLARLGQP